MKRQHIYYNAVAIALAACAISACSTDQMSEYERVKYWFTDKIGDNIGTLQYWRTAVNIKVNVITDSPAEIWLMSKEDNGIAYDFKEAKSSSTIELTAPQNDLHTVYIVAICNNVKNVQTVELTGKPEENVTLYLKDVYARTATMHNPEMKSEAKPSLSGSSVLGNAQYNEFTASQKDEALSILKDSYKEGMDAKTMNMNTNYELMSNGSFKITWFAGNTKSAAAHTLGYYYHTPGTYDDITYVDLSETELYDYIDGLAKVQYQVNDAAAAEFGVEANHWYDANFDIGDTFENANPYIRDRLGDDAYNTIAVFNRYQDNISALRGIAFEINVPKGKKVGFYLRSDNFGSPEQYDIFKNLGIRPYTTRDKFKSMNFSCEAMNTEAEGSGGTHRSCIVAHTHSLWLGMEDTYYGGDLDCNDIIFGITADIDVQKPDIVQPDIEKTNEKGQWTIAYEDVYRDADFDFNDAVIKIVPDYNKELCCVTVKAAGSPTKMYLHYDGPDGDINLGEIHELLGGTTGEYINTKTSTAEKPFTQIDCVKWPKTYSTEKDAKRFYIEIQRGTCTDCTDRLSLAESPGELPQALLVADGEWKWPLEGIAITKAYTQFARWAKENTITDYWNWYQNPSTNTVIRY